ncbi:hypothetical protein CMALT430_170023 [Carnobacterium maltaromaticum]|nr:hypothetical protein CMALT430_170023 [Carnobacterium maltaromaticum]
MTKRVTSNFPILLPELPGSTNFLLRPVLMSQLFEKKMEFRGDKKRHIKFPYFLARATRLNKLFIRLVLMSQSFGKKINSQKSKEPLFLEFPIFLTGLPGSTNFLFTRRL